MLERVYRGQVPLPTSNRSELLIEYPEKSAIVTAMVDFDAEGTRIVGQRLKQSVLEIGFSKLEETVTQLFHVAKLIGFSVVEHVFPVNHRIFQDNL